MSTGRWASNAISSAAATSKSVSGLESPKEHNAFFVDLSDRESEALLLPESFQDFPSLARRLIDVRNHNWLPKIDSYLRSGQTYFVVVGAGHIGGPNGLLVLLKGRGCKIEQL